jgi:tRNA G18 (ribose-2'-O)-methylase SpoU
MNVHDELKGKSVDEIKEYYADGSLPAAIGMTHITGDFNLGNVIRSANFFGFGETVYVGGKKGYDRRSTVGTHHYIPTVYCKTEEEFVEYISNKYTLISVENNIPKYAWKTVSLFDVGTFDKMTPPPLFLFGEEQLGISEYLLDKSALIMTIPSFGTVRSLNVGSCASIVMAMYHKLMAEKVGVLV